ncbi:MAG TPA: PqqD family protein [Candidatus Baltobacteraceae bacterium]|nr:PqqD family protein [Candidatus Baltobacteraceae bacterium]
MQVLRGSAQTGIALSPMLVATVIEDGAVLLDLGSEHFYSLNASGWAVVQIFETDGASLDRILAQCRAWGATDENEVRAFLTQLAEKRIVEIATDSDDRAPLSFDGPWQTPTLTRHERPAAADYPDRGAGDRR